MKTLYIECNMGAAGDMLSAALLELVDNADTFVEKLNNIGIPSVKYVKSTSVKCGITGTHMSVLVDGVEENEHMHDHHEHGEHHHEHHEHSHECELHVHEHDEHHQHEDHHHEDHPHNHEHSQEGHDHHHEHHHASLHNISDIISSLSVSDKVKKDMLNVYTIIAQAEGHVHGKSIEDIHFHEVGTMDAIADVAAVCMLMEELNADQIIVSPIHVGSGHVHCAHGILPVPAPATAYILSGLPIYQGEIQSELCTPTGAALLKYFATEFGAMPVMKLQKTGYGMGNKDFKMANCVRVHLGQTADDSEQIIRLACNIDDMTGEEMGYAMDKLLACGALEVYTTPAGMKKNRPGHVLNVLCKPIDKDSMVHEIFKHTTTLGIREYICNRYTLTREVKTIDTTYGPIHVKTSSGYGVTKTKLEYEDLVKIANEQDKSLFEIKKDLF